MQHGRGSKMNDDDMYALIEFLQDKADECRRAARECEEIGECGGAIKYYAMKQAYAAVLSKIFAQRCSQRPHISERDWEW